MAATKPPTLVVIQLTGGNDVLSTVVPYGNPLYYDIRPTVAFKPEQLLRIDDMYGFHPEMAPIKHFWDDGKMAIINGVGYENPNYSHFRSMDIWYTAEPEKVSHDGWLGKTVRMMDPHADNVLTAVNFGRGLPRALSLAGVPVASVAELDSYGLLTALSSVSERQSALEVFGAAYDDGWNDMGLPPVKPLSLADRMGPVLSYMGRTGLDAQKGADILSSATKTYQSEVVYPKTPLAASLRGIAQVKMAGLGTRIFYASIGSFDTHANQMLVHGKLWTELSGAIAAFYEDLKAHDEHEDTIIMLWSEFGRRVMDNGSGTDHGAGGAMFVIGDRIKGGMYGEYPSIRPDDLVGGNLKYTVDFRSVYGSVLDQWLKIDAQSILNGNFEQFTLV